MGRRHTHANKIVRSNRSLRPARSQYNTTNYECVSVIPRTSCQCKPLLDRWCIILSLLCADFFTERGSWRLSWIYFCTIRVSGHVLSVSSKAYSSTNNYNLFFASTHKNHIQLGSNLYYKSDRL